MSAFHRWVDHLLHGESTDICIQGVAGAYFLERGAWRREDTEWKETSTAQAAALAWLSQQGLSWDAKHPYLDWTIGSQVRAHLLLPPLSAQGFCLSLRRLRPPHPEVSEPGHLPLRWTGPLGAKLRLIWQERQALLIAGATGSGKTTLLRDLIEQAGANPSERTVAIEDTPEIQARHPHWVPIHTREANADGHGAVSARDCVRQALRMRPDRLLLGEVRGPEVLDLLQAANTGHRGIACTLHANSARDALFRLELLAQLAHPAGLDPVILRTWIAASFRWVAFVENQEIRELCAIAGVEGTTVLLRRVEG